MKSSASGFTAYIYSFEILLILRIIKVAFSQSAGWMAYGTKELLFVMDASRQKDLFRDDAKHHCARMEASLATVDSDDEFEFIKREIRRRVGLTGQELAHEQWWTAGMIREETWVWDVKGYPLVSVAALKRKQVPKLRKGVEFYLAISHGHDQQGWRLRGVPGNYKLRYICQKDFHASERRAGDGLATAASVVLPSLLMPEAPAMIRGKAESDPDQAVTVRLGIAILRLTQVNEEQMSVCASSFVSMEWTDPRLEWDINHYNVTTLTVDSRHLWTPRLSVHDGFTYRELDSLQTSGRVIVTSTGRVNVKVVEEVCSTCEGDALFFPFDQFRCHVELESTSENTVIKALPSAPGAPSVANNHKSAWILDRSTGMSQACLLQSARSQRSNASLASRMTSRCVRFDIRLNREMLFYIAVLLAPMLILTMPLLVLLLVSPGYRLKIPAMLVVILLYCLLLHFVCSLASAGSPRIPLIATYPLCLMVVSVTSACVSIAFSRRPRGSDTPVQLCCCCRGDEDDTKAKQLESSARDNNMRCTCEPENGVIKIPDKNDIRFTTPQRMRTTYRNGDISRYPSESQTFDRCSSRCSNDRPIHRVSSYGTALGGQFGGCDGMVEWETNFTLSRQGNGRTEDGLTATRESVKPEVQEDHAVRTGCRTSSTLERNLDMALFVVVVVLLITYIIIIISVSF